MNNFQKGYWHLLSDLQLLLEIYQVGAFFMPKNIFHNKKKSSQNSKKYFSQQIAEIG